MASKKLLGVNKCLVSLFILVVASTCRCSEMPLAAVQGASTKMSTFHLPDTSKPANYTLRIIPYPVGANPYYAGSVRIYSLILHETKEILLHSKNLLITSVYMGCNASFKLDPVNEILNIEACKTLEANKTLEMVIEYYGFLNGTDGFYQSSYQVGSKTKWVLATQFEPTFARRAFPCYDEPRFRAKFQMYIARQNNQTSISNMPLNMTQYDYRISPRVWDVYEPTPPMATYLLAFAIFEYKCEDSASGTRACTRENAIGDVFYVNSIGSKVLGYMESYTNKSFHMPLLQFITIPESYFGAMENWGLITFRESLMLLNNEVSSEKNLESVTSVICHEIAHQWFGDYVTPEWWDYVWLNEGFATYFQYYLMDRLNPSWRMKDYSIIETLQFSLFVDQARIHHPLTASVNTPKEIENIFDTISYYKGASVMRMLEHMVTPEVFQQSLIQYLNVGWNDYSGTVTPEILWDAFDQKLKDHKIRVYSTVSNIMNKWTFNPGYPLVRVSKAALRQSIVVEQVPYKSPRSMVQSTSTAEWIIPLTYTSQYFSNFNNTAPALWLPPSAGPITLENVLPSNEWIIFNIQATGYYRVHYYIENWKMIILQLLQHHERIHVLNRAQLIDDSLSLAIDNYMPFEIPFELMTYLDEERDMIPWFSALNKLDYLYTTYESTKAGPLLKEYILERLSHPYRRLGFASKPTDDHLTKTARSAIIEAACKLGMPECVQESVTRYHKHAANLSKIKPDVKKAVLCTAVNHLNREPVWMNLWNTYRKSNVGQEKETFLFTLGCTNDEELLKKYLYKLVNENDFEIRKQDQTNVFRAVFNREKGIDVGLRLIDQLLPSMTYGVMSSKTVDILVDMLNHMKHMINTNKQMKIVDDMITQAEEWDDVVQKKFMNALYAARDAGSAHLKYRNERLADLIEVLHTETASAASLSTCPSTVMHILPFVSMLVVSRRWLSTLLVT